MERASESSSAPKTVSTPKPKAGGMQSVAVFFSQWIKMGFLHSAGKKKQGDRKNDKTAKPKSS